MFKIADNKKLKVVNKSFSEWLDEQPDYGMFNPPMNAQLALDFLFDYFELEPDINCVSQDQINTYLVFQILYTYSKQFKKEYKQYVKKHRG